MSPDAPQIANPYARRVFGIALILGPLLLLASTVAYATAGDGINNGVLGGTIGVWSCFVLIIAFIGISRVLEGVNHRGSTWLMSIAVIGFTGGVAFNIDAIYTATYAEITGEMIESIAILAFLPWGWFAPLTFVMAGVLMARSKLVSWRTGILFIIAGVLFVTARPARIDVVAVIGDIILLLAMVPLGLGLLTATAESGRTTEVPADAEVGSSHA